MKKSFNFVLITLMTILLFQPVIGIAGGSKPDKQDDTGRFLITIGSTGDDIICDRTFEVTASLNGWYPDEELKGKGRIDYHAWFIPIEYRPCYFDMNPDLYSDTYNTYLNDFYDDQEVQFNRIAHIWKPGEYDYWSIALNWKSAEDLNVNGILERLDLDGKTDSGPDGEGTYGPDDAWTVNFDIDNSYFELLWNEEICEEVGQSGKFKCRYVVGPTMWDRYLKLTVKIERIIES